MNTILSGWRKVKPQTICEVCKLYPACEVDHIFPRVMGGTNDEENLADLCGVCHFFKPYSGETKEQARFLFDLYKQKGGIIISAYRDGLIEAGVSHPLRIRDAIKKYRSNISAPFREEWYTENKNKKRLITRAQKLSEKNGWKLSYAISIAKGTRKRL